MSALNKTQTANREGQEIRLYEQSTYVKGGTNTPVVTIDYANSVDWDVNADAAHATGGRYKANKVRFDNPYAGTVSIHTQLTTPELLALSAGQPITSDEINVVKYTNKRDAVTPYYVIEADCVRKGKDNVYYDEDMDAYKASVNKSFTRTYEGGDGEPQSVDLVFELSGDDDDDVLFVYPNGREAVTAP